MSKVDKATFAEIKAAQEDGETSVDVATTLNIDLEEANIAFSSPTYESYIGVDELPLSLEESKPRTGRKGFLRSQVIKREINVGEVQNGRYEQLQILNKQIKAAWEMIKLLEHRKGILVKDITIMEEYLKRGVSFAEEFIEK